jgi:hypothetical protein
MAWTDWVSRARRRLSAETAPPPPPPEGPAALSGSFEGPTFWGNVDTLKQSLVNHVLRGTTLISLGANLHLSLHTADPGGNGANETTVISRLAVARATTSWDAPASRATQNTSALTFSAPTGSATLTHVGCWDAASAGSFLFAAALTNSKQVNNGDPGPQFPAGDFDLSFTGAWSSALADAVINWLLRGQAFLSLGADIFVSLHTANPGTTGANEVTGGNYARASITRATASWTAAGTGGATENSVTVTFPAPTANWGLVTHLGLWTAASGGTFLWGGSLTTARTINNGDPAPSFASGAIDLTLT